MTDGQLAALLSLVATLVGALVAAIRWAAGRIGKSIDHSSVTTSLVIRQNTKAQIVLARQLGKLSAKVESIEDFVQTHTPPLGVPVMGPLCPHGRYAARCVDCGADPINADVELADLEDFEGLPTNPNTAVPRATTSPELAQRHRKS